MPEDPLRRVGKPRGARIPGWLARAIGRRRPAPPVPPVERSDFGEGRIVRPLMVSGSVPDELPEALLEALLA
jgi:hypothetical protein